MSILLSLTAETGHDQLWLLLAAQRMGPNLNPYNATVFESNPPLAIWLSAIVVAAAHMLHLSLTVAFKLGVTLIVGTSAAVCSKLLRMLHPEWTRHQLWLLGVGYIVLFGAVPVRDFGQRDHILALLVLPYLIAAALELSGRRLTLIARIAITLAAAMGLALKPQQALIAISVELTLLIAPKLRVRELNRSGFGIRAGVRVLEPAIFCLSAVAYFASIRFLAPSYLSQILPVLRGTYWAFGHLNLVELGLSAASLCALLAIDSALWLVRRPQSPLILLLLAAGVGATLGYLAQGTGWYYQQLPALSFLGLALIVLLTADPGVSWPASARWVGRLPLPLAAATLLAFALTIHFSDFQVTRAGIEQRQTIPDPTFFAGLPPGTAVATLTTSVDDTVPPAFRYHLTLGQRYPHLWMLPAILRNESGLAPAHAIPPTELAHLDQLQHQFMVEDLNRWHPLLILVERCHDPAVFCQVLEDRHDDLLAWFLRDPAFASIFSKYHFLRSSGSYDAYILN